MRDENTKPVFEELYFDKINMQESHKSVFESRKSHFKEEKQFLAEQVVNIIIDIHLNVKENIDSTNEKQTSTSASEKKIQKKIILLLDSGSTLLPVFEKLCKHRIFKRFRGLRDNIIIITNNIEGIQFLLKNSIEGKKGPKPPFKCIIPSGCVNSTYSAILASEDLARDEKQRFIEVQQKGKNKVYFLREGEESEVKKKLMTEPSKYHLIESIKAEGVTSESILKIIDDIENPRGEDSAPSCTAPLEIVAIVTGNYISSEDGILARGIEHRNLKAIMMDRAHTSYVLAPLGKLLPLDSDELTEKLRPQIEKKYHPVQLPLLKKPSLMLTYRPLEYFSHKSANFEDKDEDRIRKLAILMDYWSKILKEFHDSNLFWDCDLIQKKEEKTTSPQKIESAKDHRFSFEFNPFEANLNLAVRSAFLPKLDTILRYDFPHEEFRYIVRKRLDQLVNEGKVAVTHPKHLFDQRLSKGEKRKQEFFLFEREISERKVFEYLNELLPQASVIWMERTFRGYEKEVPNINCLKKHLDLIYRHIQRGKEAHICSIFVQDKKIKKNSLRKEFNIKAQDLLKRHRNFLYYKKTVPDNPPSILGMEGRRKVVIDICGSLKEENFCIFIKQITVREKNGNSHLFYQMYSDIHFKTPDYREKNYENVKKDWLEKVRQYRVDVIKDERTEPTEQEMQEYVQEAQKITEKYKKE
ncbi:MAG: hypothetical protein ACFFBD_25620 [Candidatus Hodarchaeota archaeon]